MDIGKDKVVREIIARLEAAKGNGGAVRVAGTWGSYAPMLAAFVSGKIKRPILYLCPHIDDADKVVDDLSTFGGSQIELMPAWEGEEQIADATDETRAERLRIVMKLLSDRDKFIIPASVQAICQPIPKSEVLKDSCFYLAVSKAVPPETLVGWLVDNGFEHVERVDLPGQFAHRGGIVDIFAPLVNEKILSDKKQSDSSSQNGEAIRIEFFGDSIESIRQINLDTQRSSQQIKSVNIVSAVCGDNKDDRQLFSNILPKDTIVILDEPGDIEEVANVFLERSEYPDRLYSWGDIYKDLKNFTQLHICRFVDEDSLKVDIKSVQQFQQQGSSLWAGHKGALEELVAEAVKGKKVYLYCESPAEIKRVTEIITQDEKKVPANFKLILGFINRGFVIDSLDTIIISHHELFGQYAIRRRQRPMRASAPVATLSDLQKGDDVVHSSYGIGKYLGVKTIKEKGQTCEYLTIVYADGVKMQVSVNNIGLVQKYIGTSPKRPKLSTIGSKKWQKQKENAAESVQNLAADLLDVQAKRHTLGGITFAKDSDWQAEFEESFPYQETADQITAVEQIKADMQQAIVMDRLLCGDVGYGKTELAMRAAFKAVDGGKQVAVLVPTTVLCVQHNRTFRERFADFPITIESLNRFKTAKQARDIIEQTKKGRVDVLIGTHRLLSGDGGFSDLGLLIIDEEQRFGVEHKEKLKGLRVNVDVLTMTATPIPRTLHLALLGLRDISSLGTPPLDRRSVITSVTSYSNELIRKAILREMNRQGQVFFVHNRVKTIEKKAWEIRKLIDDDSVKVAIGHGQMSKSELEQAMVDFVVGKTDVLVCTTIIESGLDIPNANTIFINDADRFGLAELHQLRGRVGRYKHRAYAYMLLPKSRPVTPLAARRLKAIEEYSHLGSGFRIALRDLEIRGAGNILGAAQSGHIQVVGYQMYCELLADEVKKLRGEPVEPIPSAVIDLGIATYIPKNYIPADRSRMDAYRKIAIAKTSGELKQLEGELADVYGPIPNDVMLLLDLADLRIKASGHAIKSIIASGHDLVFTFAENAKKAAAILFAKTSGEVRISGEKTVYLKLQKNYFESPTLMNLLRKILSAS